MRDLTAYQWRLLAFLSVACFFEGYDFIAITQILPQLRTEMDLSMRAGALLVAVINSGTLLAYLLVRYADRWGRKSVLGVTIVGYTVCSALTALAPNVWVFGLAQALARVFLIAEWATSMVYAAEEFPAQQRGNVIGLIQAFSTFGAIACAALVPFLLRSPLGWRSVYLLGAVPLVLIAFARRNLRETTRFEREGPPAHAPFTRILEGPYRNRMLQLALIWGTTYVCTQNAVTFWKEFAMGERGYTDGEVGLTVSIAAVATLPLLFLTGKLIDVVGRRVGAMGIYLSTTLGVLGAYTLSNHLALGVALTVSIFATSAVLPVMNAYTAELFPTDLRGDAFAWSNNLLGRIGYVLSPLVVGQLAESFGWGRAVAVTTVFPVLALAMILAWLPETTGRDLDETARI
jgi:putative MFS transporter